MKNWKVALIAALLATAAAAQPLSYTISTAAGGAPAFYFAEGKLATSFLIGSFATPAIDRQGNFFFSVDNRVIRVGTDGKATTYAGTGVAGSSGDGGPATSALLTNPGSVLFDPQGRLLIFDNFGAQTNRIRRVDGNGIISTIAGTGQTPPGPTDGDGGPATSARVHATQGAYDSSGNLFILDSAGDFSLNVRRIGADGRITTVARQVGQYPDGMASDGANIYLADLNPAVNRVAKLAGNAFVPITGTRVGYGGDGGPASAATLQYPEGIAVDSAGNLHIADTGNQRIRTIHNTPAGAVASGQGVISTSAGTGVSGFGSEGAPALTSLLSNPGAIAVDSADNIYISDSGSGRYRRFRLNGTFQTVAGLSPLTDPLGDGGPAIQAALSAPGGLYRDATGNLLVIDGPRLRQISPDGLIASIVGQLAGGGGVNTVRDSAGNLYILDGATLRRLAVDGTSTTVVGFAGAKQDEGPAATVSLGSAQSLAIDAQDNIYIGSYLAVRKLTPAGTVTRVVGTNGFTPSPLASGDARSATMASVLGLAVDANGNLFVSDTFDQRILKVTPAGQFTTLAGTYSSSGFSGDGGPAAQALLNHPTGLAFDAWGNLYIADAGNNRVRKIAPDGTISTVAGSANAGFAGDGGPGVGAQLSIPFGQGVATDAAGNVLLVDGNRIRKLMGDKLRADGVRHAAIQDSGPVAADLQILVRGTELIPPSSRTSLRVLFDGQPAGFVSADGSQITTVVPASVAGQNTTLLEVEIGGARTNALTLSVVAARPGILSIENDDGTINATANPANGGSIITLNLTGDGGADPSLMSVAIGGMPANIVDAPAAADSGIRRVMVQLPDGASSGDPVVISVGDANSQDGVSVWLQ
jgi:uncharacterized protein (TIGR03437 family)